MLLARTLAHAQRAGASERALITFAFNVVSQGLYVRHGLLPRMPIHLCSAERESLRGRLTASALRTRPIGAVVTDFEALQRIDMRSLGVSREKHHRYLLTVPGMEGFFIEDGGVRVGYAYLAASGHIGPLAVSDPRWMPGAFNAVLAKAVEHGSQQVSAFVPGTNEALSIAARLQMRFTLPMVFMSTQNVGDWARYLPRNPGFMKPAAKRAPRKKAVAGPVRVGGARALRVSSAHASTTDRPLHRFAHWPGLYEPVSRVRHRAQPARR